jgi:hypothetical protein
MFILSSLFILSHSEPWYCNKYFLRLFVVWNELSIVTLYSLLDPECKCGLFWVLPLGVLDGTTRFEDKCPRKRAKSGGSATLHIAAVGRGRGVGQQGRGCGRKRMEFFLQSTCMLVGLDLGYASPYPCHPLDPPVPLLTRLVDNLGGPCWLQGYHAVLLTYGSFHEVFLSFSDEERAPNLYSRSVGRPHYFRPPSLC